MEEEYTLISKLELSNLKTEVANLKEELKSKGSSVANDLDFNFDVEGLAKKISENIKDNLKNDREYLIKELDVIKNLNKNTLDNILSRNNSLDNQLDSMVSTLSELIENLCSILDLLSKDRVDAETVKKMFDDFANEDRYVLEKLEDINLFMQNLRVLLSYVKHDDLRIERS